jgi:hypothetical protein
MGLVARPAALPLRMRRPEMSAFLMVVMCSNKGNYGLPVVLLRSVQTRSLTRRRILSPARR